jgi:indole-3-glycerol phosphate synthase
MESGSWRISSSCELQDGDQANLLTVETHTYNSSPFDSQGRPPGVLAAGGVLDRIVAAKSVRVASAKQNGIAASDIVSTGKSRSGHNSLAAALRKSDRTNIIAEIKHRSPSKGIIREDFDPVRIAEGYASAGAAALSVLTEEDFFGGSLEHLRAIRKSLPETPLLRKDFLFDEYQLHESLEAGADAVLLITAILDDTSLARLIRLATELGLDALVEVHTKSELERAASAGARVIGINNRDLRDFTVDLATSLSLAPLAPNGAILVSESGISTDHDIALLSSAGFNAFLIGEHFMRAAEPGEALKRLLSDGLNGQGQLSVVSRQL